MKSRKALLSLLKVYPGNLQTWGILALVCLGWGWRGLVGFYILMVFLTVIHLTLISEGRKKFFSKMEIGKDDWLVQWCCRRSLHVWGDITVEEPRTFLAKFFLESYVSGRWQQIMRVGNGACVFCGKKENFVSFPSRNSPYSDHITWDSWTEMSKSFYEMYREEQETAG